MRRKNIINYPQISYVVVDVPYELLAGILVGVASNVGSYTLIDLIKK